MGRGVQYRIDQIRKKQEEKEEAAKAPEKKPVKRPHSDDEEEEEEVLMPQLGPCYGIRNKFLRAKKMRELKGEIIKSNIERAKLRVRERRAWQKAGNKGNPPKVKVEGTKQPHTIESLRVHDITYVDKTDEEIRFDESTDKYSKYYEKTYEPKVLVTSTDGAHTQTIEFVRELCMMIPNSTPKWRKKSSIKKMVKGAKENGFTDIVVINEDRKVPNGLLLIHLPDGPSAFFRLSNPRLCSEIKRSRSEMTEHRPEVLLNNFRTRLGQVIGRMLGALFHYEPEFKGRRVCTFHNQRDYIFFRHHRYEFRNAEKVDLRELGPRFTLKLHYLQEGAFDGDFEWVLKRHEMEFSRRKFYL